MTKNLEELVFGIWVAHGEGKFEIEQNKLNEMKNNNQIVFQYVDFEKNVTQSYPHNPNGSVEGIAGIVSKNGRHLAMMPHPERTFLKWHIPWIPNDIKINGDYSPWFNLFM